MYKEAIDELKDKKFIEKQHKIRLKILEIRYKIKMKFNILQTGFLDQSKEDMV